MSFKIYASEETRKKYAAIPFIDNEKLSYHQRGMLAYLYINEIKECTFNDLLNASASGKHATRTILNSLIRLGYLEMVSHRNSSGQIEGVVYLFHPEARKV